MKQRKIYITEKDRERLDELLMATNHSANRDRNDLSSLQNELQRATIVNPDQMPDTVVTMNTRLVFQDLDDNSKMAVTLVFPSEADIDHGKISVFSPIGTALLGYKKGDIIEWAVPDGKRRVRIEEVLYQPEAAGDHDL